MSGVLIINADDLGLDEGTSDAILQAWQAGTISSASALVNMTDSRRAIREAVRLGLPLGIHVNVVEPYSDASVAAPARERQARVIRWFAGGEGPRHLSRTASWTYNPWLAGAVAQTLREQLAAFTQLAGRPITHFDGHRHAHLTPNVALSRALPRGIAARRGLVASTGSRLDPLRLARDRLLLRRFVTADAVRDISQLGLLDESALSRLLPPHERIEIMCHPGFPEELRILRSPAFDALRGNRRLGSYGHLTTLNSTS